MKSPEINSAWKAILAFPGAMVMIIIGVLMGYSTVHRMDENGAAGWVIILASILFWAGVGYLIYFYSFL